MWLLHASLVLWRPDSAKRLFGIVAAGGRALDDLVRLARSPFLLGIAAMIVMGQILGAFMYNEQAKYVEAAYTGLAERAALFARIDLASNVLALIMQTVLVWVG